MQAFKAEKQIAPGAPCLEAVQDKGTENFAVDTAVVFSVKLKKDSGEPYLKAHRSKTRGLPEAVTYCRREVELRRNQGSMERNKTRTASALSRCAPNGANQAEENKNW